MTWNPGTHRTPEAAEVGRTWAAGITYAGLIDAGDESADEAAEELDDENDPTYGEQGAAKRRRVLSDDCVPDAVLALCRPVRRGAALNPILPDAPPRSACAQLMREPRIAVAVAHLLQLRSDVSRKTFHLLDPLGAAIRAARSAPGAAELTGCDFLAGNEGLFTDPRDSTARPCRLFAIDQEGPGTARRAPFCRKLLTCRASSRPAGRPSSIALSRLTRVADGSATFRSCYVLFHLPQLYGALNDDGSPGALTYVALEKNGCFMFPDRDMGNMVFLQYARVFGSQVEPAGGYAAALDAHDLAGRTPREHNRWGASELLRVCVPGAAHAGAFSADAARAGLLRSRGRPTSCCTTAGATRQLPHLCYASTWASASPRASLLRTWSRQPVRCATGACARHPGPRARARADALPREA